LLECWERLRGQEPVRQREQDRYLFRALLMLYRLDIAVN
jgi:hypothetical protein